MSDFRFKPVRGTEAKIEKIPYTEGAVYFTTDTNKIFLDAYGERSAMGGNSGIYYGKYVSLTPEEDKEKTEFQFTSDDIEGQELPKADDLILNIPDGCFYRVITVEKDIIHVSRLTVAGGGGSVSKKSRINILLSNLTAETLVNGQNCSVDFNGVTGFDEDGIMLDDKVTVHWTLVDAITGQKYHPGTPISLKVDDEGKFKGQLSFGSYLKNDCETDIVIYAKGNNSGNSIERSVKVTTSKLELTQSGSFSAKNIFSPNNVTLSCNAVGGIDKFIKFTFDNEVVRYELLPANAPNSQECKIPTSLATHGPHSCIIELIQALPDGLGGFKEGAGAEPLEFEIAVIDPADSTPVIWLDKYENTYYNYDNIQISYLVYDPSNTAEAVVHIKRNNMEIESSPRTIDTDPLEWNIFEITDASMDQVNTYSLECGKGDTPRRISFNVVKDPNRDMEYAKQGQLTLNFDARGRSNSESIANRSLWENEDKTIKATFNNFNWYNNGWVLDENNQTCLRISNGAEFSIPIGPKTFASSNSSAQSHSIEMQFKIRNVQDYSNLIKNITRYKYKVNENQTETDKDWYDAFLGQTDYNNYDAFLQVYLPIWSETSAVKVAYDDLIFSHVQKNISLDKAVCKYLSGNTGVCLGPQDAFFSNGTNTVNVNYVENDMVYLTIVYDHSSNNNLMYIYINGVITGVISSTVNGPWTIDTDKIVFNSNFCDIDLYKIRMYNAALTVNDVVTNHSVDKKDVLIYDQNKLAEENINIHEYQFKYKNMLKYNEEHPFAPLMPYIIYDTTNTGSGNNNRLSWAKSEKISVGVEFVNTGLDAAYARGELEALAIKDGLCKLGDSAEKKAAAVKTYYKHHCPSFKGDFCELAVQGTSSEFYPRRNYKIKTKTDYHKNATGVEDKLYHILLHKGPFAEDYAKDMVDLSEETIKYGEESTRQKGWYMDNYTNSTDRWTMKVDYMESSGSYNAGYASMAATAYSKHPLEDYIDKGAFYSTEKPDGGADAVKDLLKSEVTNTLRWQDYRTSLLGFPVLAFHKKGEDDYLYIGMYRMLLDKGSNDVLGFELPEEIYGKFVGDKEMTKKAECWEFCNNSRGFCSYRDPWKRVELSFKAPEGTPDAQAYTSKGAPIIADNIEYRYNDKEDAIDAVLNLTSMTPKEQENFKKETKLTSFSLTNPDDLEFARNWLLGVYKNWETVNKWVWSTNTDNVVGEGTYELTDMYAAKYEPNKYYREVRTEEEDLTTGQITVTISYEKESADAIFNDNKPAADWWDPTKVDEKVTYYTPKEELNDAGEVVATTYVPIRVISQEALAAQPEGQKAYIYEPEIYYIEVEGAYSLTKAPYDDSEDYYILIVGDYASKADLLVKPIAADATYDENTTYYYYNGETIIREVGAKDSLAVSEATDVTDAESFAAAIAAGKTLYVASPVTYGRKTYTHDTKEYRTEKFVNEIDKHFDTEYLATYFIMTEVFECYDSRGKNCMMASWGPLEPGGDYIWYPIFYDIDTQLGINNTGIPSFEYNVDATEMGNYSTSDSLLWNNFYKYFKNSHILNKYKHLRGVTDNVDWDRLEQPTLRSVDQIEKWYKFDESVYGSLACRGVRPLIATNLDMWWKYITITNDEGVDDGSTGWLNRSGEYDVDSNGTYFYALQGDRSQSRRQFLTNRLEYIDSWLNQGNYKRGGSNNIRGRVAANNPVNTSDLWVNGDVPYYEGDKKARAFDAEYWINLKPIRSSYVTVSDDAEAYPSQKYDGVNPVKFEITAIKDGVMNSAGYPEQLLYIYGMNQMADLGEMHNLYWQEFDLTGDASHLTTLKLGTDELMEVPANDKTIGNASPSMEKEVIDGKEYYHWYNHKMNQPSIPGKATKTNKGMPLLKEVNLSNIYVSTGSPVLDFSSCEKLQNFRAVGSNFVQFTFAEGVALHTLHLPNTLTTLELTEANLLTNLLTEYSYPTRDEYGKLNAARGLWLDGLFNNNETALSSISLKGGSLGFDSYKLLKKIFDVKQARPAEKQTTTTVQMTNVAWSPYIQLVEGDIFIKKDESLYYKDNGHMRLVPYVYDSTTFNRDVLNGEIYKYNPTLQEKSNQITDISMLSEMNTNSFWKGPSDGSSVPNITGIIYVNNTEPVDEFKFRSELAKKYPNLKFFFAEVDEAYTAKFIIQEADGTYTYAVTSEGRQGLETIKEGWFSNPYTTYVAEKENYDFHGWSTSSDPEDEDSLIGAFANTSEQNTQAWADAKDKIFDESKKTYVFYAIFTKTKYPITFMNGNSVHETLYITFGETLREPTAMPYKDDSALDLTETYAFKGYTAGPNSSKILDLSTYQAVEPYTFYAHFEEESVYAHHTDYKYFEFVDTTLFINDVEYSGKAIKLNSKYKLNGKVTLPTEDASGNPVIGIEYEGFSKSVVDNNITHIFWYPQNIKVLNYGGRAFSGNSNLAYIEFPDSLLRIQVRAFNGCGFKHSIHTGKNTIEIEENAFNNSFAEGVSVEHFTVGPKITTLGLRAICNLEPYSGIQIGSLRIGEAGKASALTYVSKPSFRLNTGTSQFLNIEFYYGSEDQKTFFEGLVGNGTSYGFDMTNSTANVQYILAN